MQELEAKIRKLQIKCVIDNVKQVDPKTKKVINPKVFTCDNKVKYVITTSEGEEIGYCAEHGRTLEKYSHLKYELEKNGGKLEVLE